MRRWDIVQLQRVDGFPIWPLHAHKLEKSTQSPIFNNSRQRMYFFVWGALHLGAIPIEATFLPPTWPLGTFQSKTHPSSPLVHGSSPHYHLISHILLFQGHFLPVLSSKHLTLPKCTSLLPLVVAFMGFLSLELPIIERKLMW